MQNPIFSAPLNVLLTGAGSIARRHTENLRILLPNVRVSAVCRGSESTAWAHAAGVRCVASVEEALDSEIDVAVVCSISAHHAGDLVQLMNKARALYVEKPVITTQTAFEQIKTLVDLGWSRPTVVGCNLRYLPAIQRLNREIRSGALGRCAHANLRVGQWLPSWRPGRSWQLGYAARREAGGGVMFDLVHELDMAMYLFGDIAHAQAAAASRSSLGLQVDDVACMTLAMASGQPVQVSMDYISRRPVRHYTVVGDEATLSLDVVGKSFRRESAQGDEYITLDPADWDMSQTYLDAMSDLIQSLATGSATRYSLADSLPTTQWMLAIEAQAWRTNSHNEGTRT